MKYTGQAPFQKPAPLGQHILSILFELQHPLRRQHLPCQPLFQHRRLIERLGCRFEDGFHDVVWIAAIHEIHVEIQATVGDEGLEEIFEQTEVKGFDLPIWQRHIVNEIGPAAEIHCDLGQRFIERR